MAYSKVDDARIAIECRLADAYVPDATITRFVNDISDKECLCIHAFMCLIIMAFYRSRKLCPTYDLASHTWLESITFLPTRRALCELRLMVDCLYNDDEVRSNFTRAAEKFVACIAAFSSDNHAARIFGFELAPILLGAHLSDSTYDNTRIERIVVDYLANPEYAVKAK